VTVSVTWAHGTERRVLGAFREPSPNSASTRTFPSHVNIAKLPELIRR
jgi:hypothetical protein